jgi:hypothetical protein
MGWKFWRPKVYTHEISVSIDTLKRWYIYDAAIENPGLVSTAMGMVPVSEEGQEHEILDSEARLQKVLTLIPFFHLMADINGRAMGAVQKQRMIDAGVLEEGVLDEEFDGIAAIYTAISFASLIATFSAGVELGLVQTDAIGGHFE